MLVLIVQSGETFFSHIVSKYMFVDASLNIGWKFHMNLFYSCTSLDINLLLIEATEGKINVSNILSDF